MAKAEQEYTAEQWYEDALEGAAEDQFTGGGVIGEMLIETGFKVYVSGMTGEELFKTFFPVPSPGKDARAAVLKLAKAFAAANGAESAPQYVIALTMDKDKCVTLSGEPVDWSHNQQKTVPMWTVHTDGPSAARAFLDAQQAARAPMKRNFWGRTSWINDPYKESLGEAGKTDQDREGKARFPTLPVIAEVYKNHASAQKSAAEYAESAPSNNGTGTAVEYPWGDEFPGSWGDDEDWPKFAEDTEMALLEGDVDIEKYADEELDEDVTWLIRALSVGGFKNKRIKTALGFEKMTEVKAALALD